jgi:thiosulfate dehydrogenase [quinone] large subunit
MSADLTGAPTIGRSESSTHPPEPVRHDDRHDDRHDHAGSTDDGVHLNRAAARSAALLRIALGLIYLWAFASQAFGIGYTNKPAPPPGAPPSAAYSMPSDGAMHFSYDPAKGYLTSGFEYSPTKGYLGSSTHGPLTVITDNLPTKVMDFLWMFAIGGLGIALTLGIFSTLAGWGGLALNALMLGTAFPPERNPLLDEHVIYGLVVITCLFIRAGDHWGLGRWWRAHTPALLN